MPKKNDLKFMAMVTGSVMLAGFIMYLGRDIDLVDQARSGYGA